MAKQDVRVELFYDGQWNDHTESVRERDSITITRGQQDEESGPTPSTCTLTFDNRNGTFNPRNPSSPLFGKINRNTPLRVLRGTDVTEDFEDANFNVTIVDGGGDQPWARSTDDAHTGTWSLKSGAVSDLEGSRVVVTPPAGATAAQFWYRTSTEEGFDIFRVHVGGASLVQLIASGVGAWTQSPVFDVSGGKSLVLEYTKDGSVASGDDAVYVDNFWFGDVRFTGEVAQWAPRRAVKGDAWTEVTASGILRRLGQGRKALRSAHTRAVLASATPPLAYWPLEDSDRAVEAASPIAGVDPMRPVTIVRYTTGSGTPIPPGGAPTFGSGIGPGGSDRLVSLNSGGTLSGPVRKGLTNSEWSVEFVVRWGPDAGTFDESALTVFAEGTYTFFEFNFIETQVRVFHGAAFPTNDGRAVANVDLADGTPHHIRYTVSQSGGNYLAKLYVDGVEVATADNFGSPMAGTVGRVKRVELNPLESSGSGLPAAIGQVTVWGSETPPIDTVEPAFGYLNEAAGVRMLRLSEEEGVRVSIVGGTSQDTHAMGAQPVASFLDIIADAAAVDMGLLYEPRQELELAYRTRTSLYNQDASLELGYDDDEIAPPLNPGVDDLYIRNDVTAQRPDGGATRVVRETGPLNVQSPGDDPDGVGVYDTQIEVNCPSDADLQQLAGWRVNLGTVPDTRFPVVTVDLDAAPGLTVAASAVNVGDLLSLSGLPDEPDSSEQLALGCTETIGTHRRLISFNCVPASPYRVFTLDSDRLASAGTTVSAAMTTFGTSLGFDTPTGGALWSTTDEPYDVVVTGERMRVTSATDPSDVQFFTVSRSINGVVKTHDAGESIQIFQPARLGL